MRNSRYYINVIIFIIRVLKLLLMKIRAIVVILALCCIIPVPALAGMTGIDAGAMVFIGETGLSISSALNGCRQIAWWPAGNTTDTPPGNILDLTGDTYDIYDFTISPVIFGNFTGTWYSYDKKPIVPVFTVAKPVFDLVVWDLDHNRDVTGGNVSRSTRITYRINTNLDNVFDKIQRPDINSLDRFMAVTLTGPAGKAIESVYTGSAGEKETIVLLFDKSPVVKESPYYWSKGGFWNRSARGGDGTALYPLGTYTFAATQDLNGMSSFYGKDDPVLSTGKKTITFIADEPAVSASVSSTAATVPATAPATAAATATATASASAPSQPAGTGTTARATWTSTPLPVTVTLLALCLAGIIGLTRPRKDR